ncbi:acyltransferase family protein, partial [Streptococcus gallolyticus]
STLSFYVLEPFLAGKSVKLLGLNLDLHPYQKWLYGVGTLLGLVTIVTIIISPAVGDFETSLLVNSLQQAQTNLNRTHT